MKPVHSLYTLTAAAIVGCFSPKKEQASTHKYLNLGSIEVYDSTLAKYLDAETKIEILADGFDWSEGPEWVDDEGFLLFTDISPNTIYRWSEEDSITVYLNPSGYTGAIPKEGAIGANGLMLNANGQLVICQHGNRQLAFMDAPINRPTAKFKTITRLFGNLRYNSPNDLTIHSNGDIYFTDPPYGLEEVMEDPEKELDYQGVYRWSAKDSTVTLVDDKMTRPNGIALSIDEKNLYVSNSDPNQLIWNTYTLYKNDSISGPELLNEATSSTKDHPGSADGMAVHASGLLFATGPGGIWIMKTDGVVVGKIFTNQPTSNCTFDDHYKTLYITSSNYLLRVKLKPVG